MREPDPHCVEPGTDPCLTCVDLLSATDKADHQGPVMVTIHVIEQEFRLRPRKVGPPLPTRHEVAGLLEVPGPRESVPSTASGGVARKVGIDAAYQLEWCVVNMTLR